MTRQAPVALAVIASLVPTSGLVLPCATSLSHPLHAAIRAATPVCADAYDTELLRLTLQGCTNGIGVGLDDKNKVNLLRPGSPASKVLQMVRRKPAHPPITCTELFAMHPTCLNLNQVCCLLNLIRSFVDNRAT